MTIQQKSKLFCIATFSLFACLVAFNYGRMTASTITLRSGCDLTSDDRDGLKPDWYLTGSR